MKRLGVMGAVAACAGWWLMTTVATADETSDPRWGDLPHTDTKFAPKSYPSLEAWQARRAWLREQLRVASGMFPELERTPLNAKIFGRIERDGYTVEKVYFESLPGFYVTGNLYRPLGVEGDRPAVACPHGHWPKGRLMDDETCSVPRRCITLAKLGAVVFSYDMIGFVDSGEQIDHRDKQVNSDASALWGLNSLALQTWSSVRVLDFLQTLPDVDKGRIGVTGASGGGTQTFIISAIDDRVTAAAPVNMISSTMQGGCICENAPLLRIEAENMEIGALFAPKPLLLISATGDWTALTPEVEYPMIRSVYALYDKADHVSNVHVDAPHNYNAKSREAAYRFFAKWLLDRDGAESVAEGELTVERPEDLRVFEQGKLPEGAAGPEEVVSRFKTLANRAIEPIDCSRKGDLEKLDAMVSTWLRHAVGGTFPMAEDITRRSRTSQSLGTLSSSIDVMARHGRPVEINHVSMRITSPEQAARSLTIVVPPTGLNPDQEVRRLIYRCTNPGADVMVVAPFGTQVRPAESGRGSTKYFATFNRTDPAEAVYDVVTVLASALRDPQFGRVNLVGMGPMGPICLVARAMVPADLASSKELRTVIDADGLATDRDEAYVEGLFIPCIRRVGGLRAIAATAVTTPMMIHDTRGRFEVDWAATAAKTRGVAFDVSTDSAGVESISAWLKRDKLD